ncbi:unnamed protein product [Lactuca saligna]|uniref:Hexosyltransferase n=1 Tax=Lactuca saligna TaxID=75948 RepID=A0AA35V868_LACSI|nr:unnamed protein product [Lactuca saligna]
MLDFSNYGRRVDHHRDMRMDIDHMSYEELLALGEQIGNAGSGLSEDFISEKARMQAEAKIAEDARRRVEEEATAEAKRKRDLERESTRQELLKLPSPEYFPVLSDNSYYHFILSTDNILAATVVVTSTVQSSLTPEKIVFHVITNKKTYAGMHSWFALNPISPAIIEVKGVHQFDWLTRDNVPVLEAVENHNGLRNYYHGNHISGTNVGDRVTPRSFASKLEARIPKYISLLNHLRIYLPKLSSTFGRLVISSDGVWDALSTESALECSHGLAAESAAAQLSKYENKKNVKFVITY